MRRALLVTAAIAAAVIFFALATLPPRPEAVDTSGFDPDLIRRTIAGAYHIHTSRSDGAADTAAVAAAAARAGLKFIVVTDHGDGTRAPDAPAYLSGVLCIDAVEISTNGGHYVALGMQPSPYPLGGDADAVVEDVTRLGGFGIAAHPDSARPSLAWQAWDAPIDGLEWLSADSEWRDETRATLARTFLHYLFRPAPALATMLDRPVRTLARWDELTQHRRVVGLAAHDAHGGIGRGMEESGARKRALGNVPSYEASFRTFSDNVILDAPLSGNPAADAREVLGAIREGRVFTVVNALATPGFVDLRTGQGSLTVRATLPRHAEVVVITGPGSDQGQTGVRPGSDQGQTGVRPGSDRGQTTPFETVTRVAPGTAAARVEIRVPGGPGTPPVPWLVTNPVYFLPPASEPVPTRAAGPFVALPPLPWHVEKDPASVADIDEPQSLRYTLTPGARASQFVALAGDLNGALAGARQIVFSGRAARPARVSVQLRYAARAGERWGRSIYLDSTPREAVVPIDRMRPLDRQTGSPPDPATASSLLFVVDLTNARPGDSGGFTIGTISAARSPAARR